MNTENTTGTRPEGEQTGDPRPVNNRGLTEDGLGGTPQHWRTLGELRAEDELDQEPDAEEVAAVVVRRQIKLDVAICFIWDRFFDLEIFPARPEGMRPAGLSDADRARAARKYRSIAEGTKPLPAYRPTRYAWE